MDTTARHHVTVVGLAADEIALLPRASLEVYTGSLPPGPDVPAVLGELRRDETTLSFAPRFPFVPGLAYTARFQLPGRPPLLRSFEVPAARGDAPRVLGVFPSGDVLPENTLRLYVLFSQPMEVRGAYRHARILDAQGAEVPLPFVEVEHGLWDPRHERLTLLFHPGRIKRGVGPGESLGAPLREGGEYRLVVDGAICDARGRALGQDFEKRFRVGAADRQSPRLDGLRVSVPLRPRDPLLVELPEPLDEALLKRLVWVEDGAGQAVTGVVGVDGHEMRWRFQPSRRWIPGSYALRVHPALEDRAGNRFDRAFDRAAPGADPPESLEALRLPFALEFPGQGRGRLRR